MRIASQMVRLVDNNNFKPMFRCEIDLLRLGDFLEKFLDDDTIVVAYVGRRDFKVVYGGDDVEFELSVACCLEDSVVDLDSLDAGAIEFFEGGNCASFLACTGWSIHEKMWEITALGLRQRENELELDFKQMINFHTKDLNRAESSWWYESVSSDRGRSLSTSKAILLAAMSYPKTPGCDVERFGSSRIQAQLSRNHETWSSTRRLVTRA